MMGVSVTDYQVISKPNNSLNTSQRIRLFLMLAVTPLVVATGFTLVGMWMVLPFFGLELSALGYAFYYVDCHATDYESIRIEHDRLVVEKREHKCTSQFIFNPYWVQVVQDDSDQGLHLYLRSHGKELEVGLYMNNEQRSVLAAQLKKRTGPIR